jgi:hypothetical protein
MQQSVTRSARAPRKGCRALPRVSRRSWPWAAAFVLGALLVLAPQGARAQGVKVGLLPSTSSVAPGATFDVSIQVLEAGSAFNAFDIYVGYDPAALTLVPQSPISLQEGSAFVAACGSRYHRFQPGADRDTITDVLLCSGASLTGPGQIYKLRFKASTTPQVATIRFLPGLQFYNAGLFVNPSYSGNAVVYIGTPLAVPSGPAANALRLSAAPNPSRGPMSFEFASAEAGRVTLRVTDLQGRLVREIDEGVLSAGTHRLGWDGRDAAGITAPPGVYVAWARAGEKLVQTRFARIR